MKKRLFWFVAVSLVLLMSASSLVSAKSDLRDKFGFTEADAEYYLEDSLFFWFRPGVEFELIDFEIPDDRRPFATFSLKDPGGLPLDREGVMTPGEIDTRFMLTYIPQGEEQKVSYHERFRDPGDEYTSLGGGMYTFKFETVLPEDWDEDASHTLAVVTTRDLRPYELDRYYDNDVHNFIPSGEGDLYVRDIVTTETCNRCHDPLALHGGRYQEVQVCQQCHNPDLFGRNEPDVSYSLHTLIHRVHSGNQLDHPVGYPPELNDCEVCHTGGTPTDDFPMLASPAPGTVCDGSNRSDVNILWGDVGPMEIRIDSPTGQMFAKYQGAGSQQTGKWVGEGQEFFLLNDAGEEIQDMAVSNSVLGCADNPPGTFRGTAGELHTNWMTRPSRLACGGCHVDIDWETGEGHLGGPQTSDDNCGLCHQPDSGNEYDASVNGAHQLFYKSAQLDGFYVEILNIEDTGPGEKPLVTFNMYDKFGPIMPAEINRMRFSIQGPNEDFSFRVEETATNSLMKTGDNWTYRFTAKIPMDAVGSYTLGVEGRLEASIDVGEDLPFEDEDQMETFSVPFAVTGDSVMPRRKIVDDYKCENCHSRLSLHGDNRQNATDYCQTCHQPDATDANVRPEGTGEPQSIDFRYMIHKIHASAELETCYTVYGYRSSFHDEWCEMEEFVGDLSNCETCHVDDSYNLPLPATNLPVTTPRDYWTPMLPETASCLSCHDSSAAAAHADSNSGDFGEACAVCHGEGATYSVERVHAR